MRCFIFLCKSFSYVHLLFFMFMDSWCFIQNCGCMLIGPGFQTRLKPLQPKFPSVEERRKRQYKYGRIGSLILTRQWRRTGLLGVRGFELRVAELMATTEEEYLDLLVGLMNKDEAEKWFGEVVPRLADLLLRLPRLLKTHYQNADIFNGMETGLRLLEAQQPGIVFLSQLKPGLVLQCPMNKILINWTL